MRRSAPTPSSRTGPGEGMRALHRHAARFVLVWLGSLAVARATVPIPLPDFDTVRANHRSTDLVVLDRHGETIDTLRVDFRERRGQWVPLNRISPAVVRAVLLSEDRRFHDHAGVDWAAVASAGWDWAWTGRLRGASTLSMQLVGMLDPDLQRPGGGRRLEQKWEQMRRARELEAFWSKAQILEAYLNMVAFRGELRGIDAAARVMFGKHPHGLGPIEAAVAAALLRGPNASVERVAHRACELLADMGRPGRCDHLVHIARPWLASTAAATADSVRLAPHFSRLALKAALPSVTGHLRTTLDARLQEVVLATVRRRLAGTMNTAMTDAAVVVLDNRSGDVLAYVGSVGENSSNQHVDHARARRQAGSTLKPFLYAQALELRYLTAASLLADTQLDVVTASGLYVPQNYDRSFAGQVSVRSALASSLNIPAVRVLTLVGPERFVRTLRRLGLPLEHDGDHYGYSLSLGSADVDLLSLANAYRALAQVGRWTPPRFVPEGASANDSAPEPESGFEADAVAGPAHPARPFRQVIDPMAAWLVGDILSDRQARARGFGLESVLATRFWTAVKTGTSKDMRDNWTLGWSSDFTVGVWVGNSRGASMRNVSGVTGAAPIWHDVMDWLHREQGSQPPPPPSGIERQDVVFEGGLEAPRTEYFLPGTAVAHIQRIRERDGKGPGITHPSAGAVLALDPDMPLANQGLRLSARPMPGLERLHWHVNGVQVGTGPSVIWRPTPGRHEVSLRTPQGQVLDALHLTVRDVPRQARELQAAHD